MFLLTLLVVPNFAAILIWVLILAIFLGVLYVVIGKLPPELQGWAKVIALVLVAIALIWWLSSLAPNPFSS